MAAEMSADAEPQNRPDTHGSLARRAGRCGNDATNGTSTLPPTRPARATCTKCQFSPSIARRKKIPQSEAETRPKRLENQIRLFFPGAQRATGVPGEWRGAPHLCAGQTLRGCRGAATQTHNGEGGARPARAQMRRSAPWGRRRTEGARHARERGVQYALTMGDTKIYIMFKPKGRRLR